MVIRIHLPPLDETRRLQGLIMLNERRNPKTGKPLSPEMRAALMAMRPAVRRNIRRIEGLS